MRLEPKRAGRSDRINPGFLPPCSFIAATVDLAMVPSTQGDGELIADLAAERPALREAQVMGICGLATANQARLFGHMSDVVAVSHPARLRQRQHAFIDSLRSRPVFRLRRRGAMRGRELRNFPCPLWLVCVRRREARKSRLEGLLHAQGIRRRQLVLFGE